jgi:hypothetical protein
MNRLTIAVLALPMLAAGCGDARPAIGFPTIDDLPANVRATCPALPEVTGSLGDLATKDAQAAVAYAACAARGDAAVAAYAIAQAKLAEARAKAEKP